MQLGGGVGGWGGEFAVEIELSLHVMSCGLRKIPMTCPFKVVLFSSKSCLI